MKPHMTSASDKKEIPIIGGQAMSVVVLLAILTLTIGTAVIFVMTFGSGPYANRVGTEPVRKTEQTAPADKVEWLYAEHVPTRIISIEPPKWMTVTVRNERTGAIDRIDICKKACGVYRAGTNRGDILQITWNTWRVNGKVVEQAVRGEIVPLYQ